MGNGDFLTDERLAGLRQRVEAAPNGTLAVSLSDLAEGARVSPPEAANVKARLRSVGLEISETTPEGKLVLVVQARKAAGEKEGRTRRSLPTLDTRSSEAADVAGPAQTVAPKEPRDINPTKDLLWALALGFGGVSAGGAFDIPVILYMLPLGFGIAGASLCLVAMFHPGGKAPWWSIIAVLAAIGGIALGSAGYSEYQDVQQEAQKSLNELDRLIP